MILLGVLMELYYIYYYIYVCVIFNFTYKYNIYAAKKYNDNCIKIINSKKDIIINFTFFYLFYKYYIIKFTYIKTIVSNY